MKPLRPRTLFTRTFSAWSEDDAAQLGAALAYYAAFSITPLLIMTLSVAGFFYHGDSFTYIKSQLSALAGSEAADTLAETILSPTVAGISSTLLHRAGTGAAAAGRLIARLPNRLIHAANTSRA